MSVERTFVMIKPDGVSRKLTGRIISVFEEAGLTVVALKMLRATKEMVLDHYPDSIEWYTAVGNKTLESYEALGIDAGSPFGSADPVEIGRQVRAWLVDYITSGDVIAMILEGNAAVSNVRRLCGNTLPYLADPGSIRGRFAVDSADKAAAEKRAVRNLIHASGNPEEAAYEIALWFPEFG